MKLKLLVASAALVMAGSSFATALPGGSLGTLTTATVPTPALFAGGALVGTAGTFNDSYSFSLTALSDLTGSVGNIIGTSFTSVLVDGVSTALTLNPSSNDYAFNFSGLSVGSHTLQVTGSYTGAYFFNGAVNATPSAVPEPESLALVLGGLGIVGMVARRRQQAR